jgi:hypothetical protein
MSVPSAPRKRALSAKAAAAAPVSTSVEGPALKKKKAAPTVKAASPKPPLANRSAKAAKLPKKTSGVVEKAKAGRAAAVEAPQAKRQRGGGVPSYAEACLANAVRFDPFLCDMHIQAPLLPAKCNHG